MTVPGLIRAAALRLPGVRRRYDGLRSLAANFETLQREHVRQVAVYGDEIEQLKKALDHAYAVVEEERARGATVTVERDHIRERVGQLSVKAATPTQVLCILTEPSPVYGKAYSVLLPDHVSEGDTPDEPGRSRLQLLEDGVPLGPAHALHSDITDEGGGRYSHWGDSLVFSASDDSDPRTNGRSYHVLLAPARSGVATSAAPAARVLRPITYFEAVRGHMFRSRLPVGTPPGDDNEEPARSRLEVLEDGVPIGPAHMPHSDIAEQGRGRYSHWGDSLVFSTSDNSDPGRNGREYHVLQLDHLDTDREKAEKATDAERARSKALEHEIEELKLRVYILQSDCNRAVARLDTLQKGARESEQRIRQASDELGTAQARVIHAENRREELLIRLAEREADLSERDQRISVLNHAMDDLQAVQTRIDRAEESRVDLKGRSAQRDDEIAAQDRNIFALRVDDLHAKLDGVLTWRAEWDHCYSRLLGATSLISSDLKSFRQRVSGRSSEGDCDVELRRGYLDLLESALTGQLYKDPSISPWVPSGYDPDIRQIGRDWPSLAPTMIGTMRLRNIRTLAEQVIEEKIDGDFLEAGGWRGGACIYMRGILQAHADHHRKVFVADSFAGLPKPDEDKYPADRNDAHHTTEAFTVPIAVVEQSFSDYNLLDERVVFLQGWLKDSLRSASVERLSLLRLDGKMYSSITEMLENLYYKISPNGFIIIDDYILPACRSAVDEFRLRMGIDDKIEDIHGAGVYWRKSI